jgi:hypothetical protein
MAQNVLGPQYKLTDDTGLPTTAGQMNTLLVQGKQEASQGQKLMRQAQLETDPKSKATLISEGRRLLNNAVKYQGDAKKLAQTEQNNALFGLATATSPDEWSNVVKGWENNGMPIPKGFPTEYSPENQKKIAAMAPLEVQQKINTELRKREEDARKVRDENRRATRDVIKDRRDIVRLAGEYGIPIDQKLLDEVFKDVKPGDTVPADKINQVVSSKPSSPIPTQVLSSLKDEFKTKFGTDIPITSGTRTREQQQDLYNRAQKGEKGIYIPTNPANFPNKQTFHDNAIDVGTNAPSGTEAFLNSKGFFRPFPKEDPVHYEFKGVPTQAKSEGVILKKQSTASLPQERAYNVLEATIQAVNDLENVSKLPEGSALGGFSGLTGKDAKGIVSGLTGIFARKVTEDDQRAFEQLASGLESAMATAVGGGYASAATSAKMQQYAKQLPRIGDSPEAAIIALGRMKQELQTVMKGYNTRIGASEQQKQLMQEELSRLDKAIPFTIDQVMDAKAEKAKGKTLGQSYTSEKSENKTSTGVTWSIPK